MLKKDELKKEAGSLMVEALAMLALIALVTPILYKKAAERTTELQDINAASQMRVMIKAVDDYLRDNYQDIMRGQAPKNDCKGTKPNFADFATKENATTTVDLQQLCDYLPYGFLDANGNVAPYAQLPVTLSAVISWQLKNIPAKMPRAAQP